MATVGDSWGLPAIFPKSLPPDSQVLPEGLGYSRDIALIGENVVRADERRPIDR